MDLDLGVDFDADADAEVGWWLSLGVDLDVETGFLEEDEVVEGCRCRCWSEGSDLTATFLEAAGDVEPALEVELEA